MDFILIEIISMGKTTCNYNAGSKDMVSFRGNTVCRVMSKSVGENSDLWEIEVQGRRGYAPKSMIMEQKILIKAADLIHVTEKTSKVHSEESTSNYEIYGNNTSSSNIADSETLNIKVSEKLMEELENSEVENNDIKKTDDFSHNYQNITSSEGKHNKIEQNHQTSNIDQVQSDTDKRDIEIREEKSKIENIEIKKFVAENVVENNKVKFQDILNSFTNQEKSTVDQLKKTNHFIENYEHSNLKLMVLTKNENMAINSKEENDHDIATDIQEEEETLSNNEELKVMNTSLLNQTQANVIADTIDTLEHNLESNQHTVLASDNEEFSKYDNGLPNDTSEYEISGRNEPQTVNQDTENLFTAPNDYAKDSVNTHSKNHEIIPPNPDYESIIHNEETSWFETLNTSFNEIVTSVVSYYENFMGRKSKYPFEQCESDIDDSVEGNNEYCSKSSRFETPNELQNRFSKNFIHKFHSQLSGISDFMALLLIEAFAILIFVFGHFCFVNRRKERNLIAKLNTMERKLFATEKECSLVTAEIVEKCKVLDGIADKSFGADDMIKQLEDEKSELREQITVLEKELETAAEAGLELNKMVCELLSNNQSGSDSIINSVTELQQQLNEQEATTIYINNLLADKSRENSELQIQIISLTERYKEKINEILDVNKKMLREKETIEAEMMNISRAYKHDIEDKIDELNHSKNQNAVLETKYDDILTKWQNSAAQVEALREALNRIETASADEINTILEIADANAKYLEAEKKNELLKDSFINEKELGKRLQNQNAALISDNARLRSLANHYEKEKLEAQTRLDVLSCYFKEKETQLQRY